MRIALQLLGGLSILSSNTVHPVALARATIRDSRGPVAHATSVIVSNDNRRATGRLTNGVLTVALEAREGVWRPHGASGASLTSAAFAEVGRPLETPGPLLRVPVGTAVHVTITNALRDTMWVYGLGKVRGMNDSAQVLPGATKSFDFAASDVGTFWYAARTGKDPVNSRLDRDTQLGGVIVIDPPGVQPPDRIFAVTAWAALDSTRKTGLGPGTVIAFNGRSYPNTERLTINEGDTTRWRFVNLSGLEHPLHLHGAYYRVNARGDGASDTLYAAADQRMVVTELVTPMQTMAMSFAPQTPGNWIFHCHIASHITDLESMERDWSTMTPSRTTSLAKKPTAMSHDMHDMKGMNMDGLVMRFVVTPKGPVVANTTAARPIRLVIRSKAAVYGAYPGYSISREDKNAPADGALRLPGPLLDLIRGERVAIMLVNKSHERAAIHWHGIELESYPDGVPGVSGIGTHVLPFIEPGDSLVVPFTPPRAGTFMYHSHSNEIQQIASGIYGAIVVRDRIAPIDTSRDRVMLISDNGPNINLLTLDSLPDALLNGQRKPAPMILPTNVPLRLRLINIRSELAMEYAWMDGDSTATWRPVAKDGFDLPTSQATSRRASVVLNPGEIMDVEVIVPLGTTRAFRYAISGVRLKDARRVLVPVR